MANVPACARVRKSRVSNKSPKCPTCGGPLVVERDTPDHTTLVCPKCRKAKLAEWLAGESSFKVVQKLARKHKALAMGDAEDLASEVVVALLEHECPADAEGEGFVAWVETVVQTVAGKLRNVELREARAVDGEVLQAVVAEEEEGEPPFEKAEDMMRFLANRKDHIRRALGKLSEGQRKAIVDRYFRNTNLAEQAKGEGGCDSRDRMRLLRAKKRLAQLIDADGYVVAA